jgi:hypothetical protein
MTQRQPSFTKSGPGRRPICGKPGASKRKARGFKGATFAPARPLSPFAYRQPPLVAHYSIPENFA